MAKGREQCDSYFLETVLSTAVVKKRSFRVNSLLSWPRVKCESAAKDLENAQKEWKPFLPPYKSHSLRGLYQLQQQNRGYSLLNETIVLGNSLQACF